MTEQSNPARRALLRKLALGLSLAPLAGRAPAARSAELSLLSVNDPAAKAQHYVEVASGTKDASAGAMCSNCSLYGTTSTPAQGTCTLFPGKLVKAAGWCSAWSGL